MDNHSSCKVEQVPECNPKDNNKKNNCKKKYIYIFNFYINEYL